MLKPITIIHFTALPLLLLLSACGGNQAKLPPEALLAQVREDMLGFRFNEARNRFRNTANPYEENDPLYAEYSYLQALSFWQSLPPVPDDIEKAQSLFSELADKQPESGFAPKALLFAGRIQDLRDYQGDEPDWEGARASYAKILENYPESPEASEAAIRIALTFMKDAKNPDAIREGMAALENWLQAHPDSAQAAVAAPFLAYVYDFRFNNPQKALQYYRLGDQLGFVNQTRTGANLWRMHELALEQGEILEAAGYCRRIVQDFSRSGRGYEAWTVLDALAKAHPDLNIDVPEFQDFDEKMQGDVPTQSPPEIPGSAREVQP